MMFSPFIKQRLTTLISSENFTNIERLAAFVENGTVVPTIAQRLGLAERPAAMRHLKESGSSGKSVIAVRD